jgi:hypothetical protein
VKRRLLPILALSLPMVLVACGNGSARESLRQNRVLSSGTSLASVPYMVYIAPGQGAKDGELYTRSLTASGNGTLVGSFTTATLEPSSATPVVAAYALGGTRAVIDPRTNPSAPTVYSVTDKGSTAPGAMLLTSQSLYLQEGDAVIDSRGSARYSLPSLPPDSTTGGAVGATLVLSQHPSVESLLVDPNGDVIALIDTGRAAALDDLTRGKLIDLTGYGHVQSAVVGSDGNIYVVGWRPSDPTFTIKVLEINSTNLTVSAVTDTGVVPATDIDNIRLVPFSTHGIALAIVRGDAGGPMTMVLWTVQNGVLQPGPDLPSDIGLDMAMSSAGQAYLYGGPAGRNVSIVDMSTGVLTTDAIRSPTGTYVMGVSLGS